MDDIKLAYDQIIQSSLRLHDWLGEYNQGLIGYGYDSVEPHEKLHYPEAYALFCRGYLRLSYMLEDKRFLNTAKKCLEWLKANRSPETEYYCWGSPFDTKVVPAWGAWLIDTTFCSNAFLDFYEYTKQKEYLKIAESTAKWMVLKEGYVEDGDSFFFLYERYKSRFFIVNASAEACGFLARMSKYSKEGDFLREKARNAMNYLIKMQNSDGSWNYSVRNTTIDNVHMAYTLEGMYNFYNVESSDILLESLQRGMAFLWNNLYVCTGYGKERIVHNLFGGNTRNFFVSLVKSSGLVQGGKNPETRLWGYGSTLRAFAESADIDGNNPNRAIQISKYVTNNLQDPKGYFYYRKKDSSCFIRHQAHIFAGLMFTAFYLHKLINHQQYTLLSKP